MRNCTVLFGDLRMLLAVIFGFINEIYARLFRPTGIYGHIRSMSVMYVDIRLLRELVHAPQHTLLPMDRIIIPICTGGYIRSDSDRYVFKMRDTV